MRTELTVEGMSCGGCENAVETALENIGGVTAAEADREHERATVDAEDGVSVEALVTAIEDAGFSASA